MTDIDREFRDALKGLGRAVIFFVLVLIMWLVVTK